MKHQSMTAIIYGCMAQWRLFLALMLAGLLASCGGGGGSSSGGGSSGAASPVRGGHIVGNPSTLKAGHAYKIRFNKLEGLNEIVIHEKEEAWINPADPEEDAHYIELEQVADLELRFVVPYGLKPGSHDLTVILGGLDVFSFDVMVAAPELVERETAHLYLNNYISNNLLDLDSLIASLQSQNVGTSQINPLIDARNTLASVNLNELDHEQINFLYLIVRQQQLLMTEQAARTSALYDEITCSKMGNDRIKEIARVALGAGLVSTAVYGAAAAPVLAGAIAAIGGATLYVNARKLVDEFPGYWDGCVYPSSAELIETLLQPAIARSQSSTPAIDYPEELELNTGQASQYQLAREMGVSEALEADFFLFMESMQGIAEKYAFLVPETVENQISQYFNAEDNLASSSNLSILSISTPEIQGTLSEVNADTFTLSFTASAAFYAENEESQFEFTLYDAEYEQNINFVANIGTVHCPGAFTKPSITISIEETSDSCIVKEIYSLNNPSDYAISEFVRGRKIRFEEFQSDLTIYLEEYWPNGKLAAVVDYYPLRQNNSGTLVNLVESIYHYYENGQLSSEDLHMEPFMALGEWFTHTKILTAYDEGDEETYGEVYTEYRWSDPLPNDNGSYAVCEESSTHWSFGYYTAFDYDYEFDEDAGYWHPVEGGFDSRCEYFPYPQ